MFSNVVIRKKDDVAKLLECLFLLMLAREKIRRRERIQNNNFIWFVRNNFFFLFVKIKGYPVAHTHTHTTPPPPKKMSVTLTPRDLSARMASKSIILFYAPWCGHCKRLKPEYEQFATEAHQRYGNQIQVGSLNFDEHGSTIRNMGASYGSEFFEDNQPLHQHVRGFPTMIMFQPGHKAKEVQQRSKEGLMQELDAFFGKQPPALGGGGDHAQLRAWKNQILNNEQKYGRTFLPERRRFNAQARKANLYM